jgi:hypothetical protein
MRTHLVPSGTMPQSIKRDKFVPLSLPQRFMGGPAQRSGVSQASSYASIPVFGFNGSPMRSGGTNGEVQILSRRNVSKFTTV